MTAVALLAVQQVGLAGLTPAYSAAAGGGDTFVPDDRTFLHVKNGSGGSITVTVDSIRSSDQGTDVNVVVVIPAAEERMIGPFDPARFRGSAGTAGVTYSGVTSLTVAAVRC